MESKAIRIKITSSVYKLMYKTAKYENVNMLKNTVIKQISTNYATIQPIFAF